MKIQKLYKMIIIMALLLAATSLPLHAQLTLYINTATTNLYFSGSATGTPKYNEGMCPMIPNSDEVTWQTNAGGLVNLLEVTPCITNSASAAFYVYTNGIEFVVAANSCTDSNLIDTITGSGASFETSYASLDANMKTYFEGLIGKTIPLRDWFGDATGYAAIVVAAVPTLVVLYDFDMQEVNSGISVCWLTASEKDTLGFDLLRWDTAAGEWDKVNSAMIPATGWPNGGIGASYCVEDAGANATDTFRYKLVEYETDGDVREYGPFDRSVWTPRLDSFAPAPDGLVIRWLSREGDAYDVLKALDARGPYAPAAAGLPATPPVNAWTDETAGASGFYRIESR